MRRLAAADVRRWRARRWYLTRKAPDAATAVAALPPLPALPAAYLSLFARVEGFRPESLDELIFQERSLQPYPLWRMGTLLVPVEWVAVLEATHRFRAGAGARRSRVWRRREELYRQRAPAAAEFLLGTARTVAQLVDAGALDRTHLGTWQELRELLNDMVGRGDALLGLAGSSLMDAEPSFASAQSADMIPPASLASYEFLQEFALHYFRTAGPATRDDFVWWASISYASARHSIEDLAGLLEEIDIEGARKAHFMMEEDAAELRGRLPVDPPRIAFLPSNDPARMATAAGFSALCEPDLVAEFSPRGRRTASGLSGGRAPVVVDGKAVGVWQWDSNDKRVKVQWSRTPAAQDPADVEAGVGDLEAFLPSSLEAR